MQGSEESIVTVDVIFTIIDFCGFLRLVKYKNLIEIYKIAVSDVIHNLKENFVQLYFIIYVCQI